jgi:DNA primase
LQTLSAEQRRFFEQAATTYQNDLLGDTSAQAYLATRRISLADAGTFRLGVVRRPLPGHEALTGRLVIPYLTPAGVVNFSFRCLRKHDCKESRCPKYLPIEGMERNLFNVLDLKKDSPFICVTEGELDALALSLAGLPAVGVPGVKNWKKHFSRCLEDFEVIYAIGDSDDAGTKFNSFLARETRARPIRMPPGEDCNSLFVKGGADALRRLLD